MRAIDADALHKRIKAKNTSNAMMRVMKAECLAEIDDAPTIEPERKTGEWKKLSGSWFHNDVQCSECGNTLDMNGVNAGRGDANFCPNCGADMRGEQDD